MSASTGSMNTLAAKIASLEDSIQQVSWSEEEKNLIVRILNDVADVPAEERLPAFAKALKTKHEQTMGVNRNTNLIYELLYHLCRDYTAPAVASTDVVDQLRDRVEKLETEKKRFQGFAQSLLGLLIQAHREVQAYGEVAKDVKAPTYARGTMEECKSLTTAALVSRLRDQQQYTVNSSALETLRDRSNWPTSDRKMALRYFAGPEGPTQYADLPDAATGLLSLEDAEQLAMPPQHDMGAAFVVNTSPIQRGFFRAHPYAKTPVK